MCIAQNVLLSHFSCIPSVAARINRLAHQIVDDRVLGLIIGSSACGFASLQVAALVSLAGVVTHFTVGLYSNRRLGTFLVHLILHEHGFRRTISLKHKLN